MSPSQLAESTPSAATPPRRSPRPGVPGRVEAVLSVEDLSPSAAAPRRCTACPSPCGRGEIVGLVGESGSGKTLTCRAVLGLARPGLRPVRRDRIELLGDGDTPPARPGRARPAGWNKIRGTKIGIVFQDPASYLNPSITVGRQLAEALRRNLGSGRAAAKAARAGAVRLGRPAPPGARLPSVPARTVRRHGPARADRDRDQRRPGPADRRRGHQLPGRARPGRGARPAARPRPRSAAWPCCWSRTTWPSSPRSATGCWCATAAIWSSRAPTASVISPRAPAHQGCWTRARRRNSEQPGFDDVADRRHWWERTLWRLLGDQ
jgi:hypothetical protein